METVHLNKLAVPHWGGEGGGKVFFLRKLLHLLSSGYNQHEK